jgi:hypothetical protein
MLCGCIGDDGHEQRWDDVPPSHQTPIVWRRSFPHRTDWIHLSRMADALVPHGYQVKVVMTVRDWDSMARSQVRAGHVQSIDKANANIARAYAMLFEQVPYYSFAVVSYEEMVCRPEHVTLWIANKFQLNKPSKKLKTYDGNEKYYGAKR